MTTNTKHIATLYLIIGLLTFSLFFKCNRTFPTSTNTTKVVIPAKDGTFVSVKPQEIVRDTLIRDTIIYKDKKIVIDNTDKEIVKKYLEATDSIAKLNILLDVVKIRQYKQDFDNDDIKLTFEAETVGTLNWIKPTYTIKERVVETPVITKNTVFALYGGFKISNNLNLNNPSVEGNIGIQNKKGSILSIGYDTQQNISLGYSFRLINIKK